MNTTTYKVPLTTDENGLVGRECPQCHKYFKVKFGTGLPTTEHICPYCEYKSSSNNFLPQSKLNIFKALWHKKCYNQRLQIFRTT